MTDLMIAASPVEIEAKADELGLAQAARDAATRLFHELTSQLELSSFRLRADGGQEWPHHLFLFGATGGAVTRLRDSLAGRDGVADVTAVKRHQPAKPHTLFICGAEGTFSGVLIASRDADRLQEFCTPSAPR